MINLLYESLPNSITVGDKDFLINTDFKYWIELSDALNNQDCDKTYLTNVILNLFVDEIPNQFNSEVFMAIKKFFDGNIETKDINESNEDCNTKNRIYDFKVDGDYFIAAFLQNYNIDLLKSDMHWFKFMALFHGLKDCELKQRMYYRSVNLATISDKKERSRIRKIQNKLKLDQKTISDEDIAQALW